MKLIIKACFNMVEVVLAMAVIALAMTSVLALLPVGLNASRDAVNLNYSADAVANFVGRIKSFYTTKYTSGTYIGQYRYSRNVLQLSMYLPGDPDYATYACAYEDPDPPAPPYVTGNGGNNINDLSKTFATAVRNGDLSDKDGDNNVDNMPSGCTKLDEGIYNNSNLSNCFFILQGRFDANGNPVWEKLDDSGRGKVAVDLVAMIYIWKKPSLGYYEEDDDLTEGGTKTWTKWPLYPDNFKYFSALNVEVSWPLAVDYSKRERSYFCIEFTNPNPSEYVP